MIRSISRSFFRKKRSRIPLLLGGTTNGKEEVAGIHPENEAGLFTLASTRWLSKSSLISNSSQFFW
jgi:hypothetical protein